MKRPRRTLHELLERIRRYFRREPDDSPYAMVGAPKKPRRPQRSASAAQPLE
jgi:hypothetical protein